MTHLRFALPALFVAFAACQPAEEGPADVEERGTLAASEPPAAAPPASEPPAARPTTPRCDPAAPRSCTLDDGRPGAVACSADGLTGECLPASCDTGESFACTTESGADGARYCSGSTQSGAADWSACAPFLQCQPGESVLCGGWAGQMGITMPCTFQNGGWSYSVSACNTPLVLSFDNAPVEFTRPSGFFDVVGAGASFETDWVSSATPWLAIDLDGDGAINDGSELFGSMSVLPSGLRAPNGFAALAALDDDGDGLITAADRAFSRLLLWRDVDQDRRSSPRELRRAGDEGLVALELSYRNDRVRCVGSACEVERAGFRFRDASGKTREGSVVDVHFAAR